MFFSYFLSFFFFFFWYSKLLELSSAHNFGYSGIGLWFELVVWWLAFVCVCVCAVLFCSFLHDSFLLGFVFIAVFWGWGSGQKQPRDNMGKISQSTLTGRLITCASNGIKQAV